LSPNRLIIEVFKFIMEEIVYNERRVYRLSIVKPHIS
jgi:hypothetical protein